jgi:glutamate receptor, ionotropic, invertebrate
LGTTVIRNKFDLSLKYLLYCRFIIIASYTANLAAFLTVSRLDTPVESLEDLSKQYKVLYAPLNGSSAMTYFQRMADIERRFYE